MDFHCARNFLFKTFLSQNIVWLYKHSKIQTTAHKTVMTLKVHARKDLELKLGMFMS
jgi:hypothetical protein